MHSNNVYNTPLTYWRGTLNLDDSLVQKSQQNPIISSMLRESVLLSDSLQEEARVI